MINGDLIKESAKSRNLVIPSEDNRVKDYFFQFKTRYKTFEPKNLKLHHEKSEEKLEGIRIFIEK